MLPDDVLEANLRALLTRAYVPVRPSSAFRARLLRELGPRPANRAWRLAAAAALIAVFGLALRLALTHARLEPSSMVRLDGEAWRRLSESELQHGVEYANGTLELQLIRGRHETLWLGAHGSIALEESAELRVTGSANAPVIELAAGRARLERLEAGPAWRISAGALAFELASGSLRLEQRPPELFARLDSGAATYTPAHEALPVRRELCFRDGLLVDRPVQLESLRPGGARTAFAPGPAQPDEPAPAAGAPTLRFAGRLRGSDGAPWSGEFTLVLVREERLPNVARALPRAFHDAQGAFDFPVARPGRYTLFALAAGQATLHRAGLEPAVAAPALELQLEAGSTVRGRVLDALSGVPIAGVSVLSEDDAPAQILDFDPAELPQELAARARTDEQGRFVLEHLSSGLHTLRASAAGHSAVWSPRIDTRGALSEVELRLGSGGTIEAQVEPPRAGEVLVASAVDYSFQRPCLSYALARTDALGQARFEHLPAGPFVVLSAEEQPTADVCFTFVREGASSLVHLGPVASDHALDGRLLDPLGAGLADIDLMLQSADGQDGLWRSRRTDAQGRFHFDGVRSGGYTLFAGDMGRNFVEIDRPQVGTLDVVREIVLPRGEIAGQVRVAATGSELAQAWLLVQRQETGGWRFAGKTQADAQGRFRFKNLAPGTWRVVAYAQSERLAPTPSQALIVDANGEPLETEIALGPGAALDLQLVDERGEPVAGASVELRDGRGYLWKFSPDDRSDPSGHFALPGMPPGRWTIRVAKSGAGQAERTIQLEVDQLSTLEIRVTSR